MSINGMKPVNLKTILCAGALLLAPSFASADIALCDTSGAIAGTFNINSSDIFVCEYSQNPTQLNTTLVFTFQAQTEETGAIGATTQLGLFGTFDSATLSWSNGDTAILEPLVGGAAPFEFEFGFSGSANTVFSLLETQTLTLDIQNWSADAQQINIQVLVDTGRDNPVVPIPAAAWLFGSALLGLVAVGRRRPAV